MVRFVKGLDGLRVRRDFLATAKGDRQVRRGFVLQARNRQDKAPPRFGLTASKKVGNAVMRNRTRRRLRAAAQEILPQYGHAGFDYVLVGRVHTRGLDWRRLKGELKSALKAIHKLGDRADERPE